MLRNYTMDWSLQKIENIFPGIEDVSDPDFQAWAQVNAESTYWMSKAPEITLYAVSTNTAEIYLQEHPGSSATEKIRLIPWQPIKLSYSDVKAMNIFYVSWTVWDVLFVLCR